jgi:hypothetical protein
MGVLECLEVWFCFCRASTKNNVILGFSYFFGSNQKSQFCGFFDDADVAFRSYVVTPLVLGFWLGREKLLIEYLLIRPNARLWKVIKTRLIFGLRYSLLPN